MIRLSGCSAFVIVCGATAWALGRPPLIDPPTPPPCAADGTCYPNTSEWGYYPSRWRTWPGVSLEPTPSKGPTQADGRVSEELGHSETPPAELEDAAAPPSSPRREKPAEAPPTPGTMPPADETGESPGMPLPRPERPSLAPPDESLGQPIDTLGPSSDNDPPPALPRSLSAHVPSTSIHRAATLPSVRPATSRVSTSDPPPSPPWAQSASL